MRGWLKVLAVSLGLAVVSLLSNITTVAQLSGTADLVVAIRFTVSKIVNAGAVWAGLGVLAGWFVRRPAQGFLAGIVAGELSLVAHYALGQLVGSFGEAFGVIGYDTDIWASNADWFVIALACGPLGVIGSLARRADVIGLITGLVVPLGMVLEPFVMGMFAMPQALPWTNKVSSVICGIVLIVSGLALGTFVVRGSLKTRGDLKDDPAAGK